MAQLDNGQAREPHVRTASALFSASRPGLLDARVWHEWLALFAPDARYWARLDRRPKMTSDPTRQTSMIYADRIELEARIFRIESEDS